jgi:hypothetical protein
MSEIKVVPIKFVLALIADQAAGRDDEFKEKAVQFAYELDKTDSELAQYILAQYQLIPTWVPQEGGPS